MDINEAFAISNKPGEITLTGFHFIKDMLPQDFEVCLIIEKNGHLSAGCWDTGLWSTENGRGEIYYLQSTMRAWHDDLKEKLLEGYYSGRYTVLPKWEE